MRQAPQERWRWRQQQAKWYPALSPWRFAYQDAKPAIALGCLCAPLGLGGARPIA